MRLVSVRLSNIRSYEECECSFESGITLLAGDIGSGKSTLLLAVEFALFGISRSELSGQALLRHGAPAGEATIEFSVGETLYAVHRRLKRTGSGIVQDTGWLEANGRREQLTPSELRARIFEILGYPLQFLSKQKNLLYRHTIYTPQEEMKAVLQQTAEERIEAIRRVFGIDAYRSARENAQLLARAYKERSQAHAEVLARIDAEIARMEEKLTSAAQLEGLLARARKNAAEIDDRLKDARITLERRERELGEIRERMREFAMQERARKMLEEDAARLARTRERLEQQRVQHASHLATCRKRLEEIPPVEKGAALSETQELLSSLNERRGAVLEIIESTKRDPLSVGECPTCRQKVTEEHVVHVEGALHAKREAAERKLAKITREQDMLRERLKELHEQERGAQERVRLQERIADSEERLRHLEEQLRETQAALEEKRAQQGAIPQQAARVSAEQAESAYKRAQEALARLQRSHVETEKELSRLEEQRRQAKELEEELKEKREEHKARKRRKERAARLHHWLTERFSPFTQRVEQHVLGQIHATFAAAFREWFSRLVPDDGLLAALDSQFTPRIEQHGYDTDPAHLSGGERTAVSLAYRLAFVHAIHTLLPHLGTAGLIILDEPTDGFSSEQLDNVRDVLAGTKVEQIIIVSHELQLEGFVDRILRVEKRQGTSSITGFL